MQQTMDHVCNENHVTDRERKCDRLRVGQDWQPHNGFAVLTINNFGVV